MATTANTRRIRILTIDNGGLQAMSILLVLQNVCAALSKAEGSKRVKSPCELFDVIAGIGTGGWLAILLGRDRLDILQCMTVYIDIASTINPNIKRSDTTIRTGNPAAINRERLIERINRTIEKHDMSRRLLDEGASVPREHERGHRKCYAFAVGVLKRHDDHAESDYRLFRTYERPANGLDGPDPAQCEVSHACAATAAAKDFLREVEIERTTYWDDDFPLTHNVSCLALDEADAIFGPDKIVDVVVNISPGLPSKDEVKALRRTARSHATTRLRIRNKCQRALSAIRTDSARRTRSPSAHRHASTPPASQELVMIRSNTDSSTSSTSSNASKMEKRHQKVILDRLATEYGDDQIYQRLELGAHEDKPYLDDIERPRESREFTEEFLHKEAVVKIINNIVDRSVKSGANDDQNRLSTHKASPSSSNTYRSDEHISSSQLVKT